MPYPQSNNTAGNSLKSHRYQSIRTHDWKSHEAAHRPRNCPSRPGAPRGCNSTVCAQQLRERLEVLHARAALKQQQSDLTNDTQFNPTSEVKFSEGDMVMYEFCEARCIHTPMAWPI